MGVRQQCRRGDLPLPAIFRANVGGQVSGGAEGAASVSVDRVAHFALSRRMKWTVVLLCFLGLAGASGAAQENWPQFRGPGARGVSENEHLPESWSTNKNVEWRIDVPGRGWSSPVVWGKRIFLTTVTSEGKVEEPRKGLYFGGERKEPPSDRHAWLVLCYDLESGRELWRAEAHAGVPPNQTHLKNTYASETPATDGERVYVYFGNIGLFCYDLEGKPLWSARWDPVKTRYGWGSAASPIVYDGRVYLVNDNEDGSFVTALDAKTGREIWRKPREEKSNWATPFIWRNALRTELVTAGTHRVRSYDLEGNLLWELGGMSSISIPTPFAGKDLLYVCSGYVGDKTRPIFAIKPGASGDISLKPGETGNDFMAWFQPAAGPYNPSPLLAGDFLYVLFDFGFLSCHNAKTGEVVYEKQRIRPEGQTAFTASPWAARGKIFALSEEGDTYVFEAGPEYRLLGKNSLEEMCMASPALAGDRLILRTISRLYSIREKRAE